MYQSDELQKKWQPVLEHQDLPEIKDAHKRAVTATLLENQENLLRNKTLALVDIKLFSTRRSRQTLWEHHLLGAGDVDTFDPVLISLVRRSMPNLIAYDICGVQPMTGPTGLIFAMRSRFSAQDGTEALFNEADTSQVI